jgi:hypothetical protein
MSSFNNSSGDRLSGKSGQAAQARFETGRVYSGTIIKASHGDNLYEVSLDSVSGLTVQCRWTAGMFAPLVGIRTMYYPPVQSRVLILASAASPHFIVSSIPSEQFNGAIAGAKNMTGLDMSKLDPFIPRLDGRGLEIDKPIDLLEGEFDISNNLGVALQLLTTCAALKGSERAKIEAFVLNDMVRIVSDTFKHFSCFGDMQIYNDGRLNARWDGTSYDFEAWGLLTPEEAKAQVDNFKVKYEKDFNATGRWRFSHYLGFLGDFIHMFITDPAATLSSIADNAIRPGKSRFHANMDGSILIQSVADIALERVIRVVTPVENKRPDDPGGNTVADFKNLDKSFLKLWNFGIDARNAHYTSYQLRQYARWLSCYHSFARFHQLDKDWSFPLETDEAAAHSWTNKESDVEAANPESLIRQDVYATIRIMRDGAILIMDSFSSAISMVRGNIQISSARHIELDAAGDIRINAGQNIYIKARRNIEIAAIVGGLTLKARAWWKALCEWGSVWIKSDAEDPTKPDYTPKAPVNPDQDPAPEVRQAAVCIEASQGQALIQSERRSVISVLGNPDDNDDLNDTSASVVVQSARQDVRNIAGRNAILRAKGTGAVESRIVLDAEQAQAVVIKCSKLLAKAFLVDFNNKFTLRYGTLNIDEVRVNRGHFKTVVSGPRNLGKDYATTPPLRPHGNHLTQFDDETTPVQIGLNDSDAEALNTYKSNSVNDIPISDDPDWAFFNDTKTYDNSGFVVEPTQDEVFQPMAQQRLYQTGDDYLIKQDDYDNWVLESEDILKAAPRTDSSSLPYPGRAAKEKVYEEGASLQLPLDEPYSEQSADKAKPLVDKPVEKKFLKNK